MIFHTLIYSIKQSAYLFSLLRCNAKDLSLFLVQNDLMNAGKHLLEVFLQSRDVLAVADNFQKILVTDKVKPVSDIANHITTTSQSHKTSTKTKCKNNI